MNFVTEFKFMDDNKSFKIFLRGLVKMETDWGVKGFLFLKIRKGEFKILVGFF